MKTIALLMLVSVSLIGSAMAADDTTFKFPVATHSQTGIDWPRAGQDKGWCYADCDSAQGSCIGNCSGNASCISNCSSAHATCVSNCSFQN